MSIFITLLGIFPSPTAAIISLLGDWNVLEGDEMASFIPKPHVDVITGVTVIFVFG